MREDDLLKKLLELLLSFPDRSIAVGAATKALNILRTGQEVCTLSTWAVAGPSTSKPAQSNLRRSCL